MSLPTLLQNDSNLEVLVSASYRESPQPPGLAPPRVAISGELLRDTLRFSGLSAAATADLALGKDILVLCVADHE